MLEQVKAQYEEKRTFPSKYDLRHPLRGKVNTSRPRQYRWWQIGFRKSLKRFLAAKKHGIAGIGFPRFKKGNSGTPSNSGSTAKMPTLH